MSRVVLFRIVLWVFPGLFSHRTDLCGSPDEPLRIAMRLFVKSLESTLAVEADAQDTVRFAARLSLCDDGVRGFKSL